jgi:hypothetical protein
MSLCVLGISFSGRIGTLDHPTSRHFRVESDLQAGQWFRVAHHQHLIGLDDKYEEYEGLQCVEGLPEGLLIEGWLMLRAWVWCQNPVLELGVGKYKGKQLHAETEKLKREILQLKTLC